MLESWSMQHRNGIGLHWARTVLTSEYQSDSENPMVTKARIWNKDTKRFNTIEIGLGIIKSRYKTIDWKGRRLK